jgi:hypothetical protein
MASLAAVDKAAASYHPPVMNPSLEKARIPRRIKVAAWWLAVCLPFYVLSSGPVAWATNDAFHPRYLPDEVNYIHWPLAPLMLVPGVSDVFEFYTVNLWEGFPAGYTTL